MLPFLTLAFIGGLVLGSLIPYYPLSVAGLLILAAVGLACRGARRHSAVMTATVSFGCLLCGILYWFVTVEGPSQAASFDARPDIFESCRGRVIAPVQYSSGRMMVVVLCEADGARPFTVRLTWRAAERRLYQGDRIAVRARFRAPSGSLNPGGFDYAAYLERQGIDAVATVNGLEAVELLESGRASVRWYIWNHFDRWRDAIRLAALQSLSQPALGIFLGVVIGERGFLDPEVRDQFMITGTVHLLSISGSHLGLVAMLAFFGIKHVFRWLPASWLLHLSRRITPTRLAAALTVVPAAAYACLAGAEVATVRSLVMVLVALVAKWIGCEQRMFHALGAAALSIVLHDPQAIYDISFQLSFLSVCAVASRLAGPAPATQVENLAAPSLYSKAGHWMVEALAMSAIVTVTTLPLVAFYFNQVSWLGLLTNLAAVPVMGGLLVPIGLLAALGQGGTPESGLPFAAVLQWSMDGFVSVLRAVSGIPGGEWHVASPSIPAVLAFYGGLGWIWISSDRRWSAWLGGAGLLLLLCWWLWSPRLVMDDDRFRITFLDVAQGDSAVLELPGNEVILIDGGGSYERFDMGRGVVAPFLWNRGIRTIDYVIATHPQLDHVGGLAYVLKHFAVRHYWGTGDARQEPFYQRLQGVLAERDLREHIVRQRQDGVTIGPCRLDVLNPPETVERQQGRGHEGHRLNNRSIVTALSCGRHRLLFTADVEAEALMRMSREAPAAPAALVKVPHHGAASSLEQEWLERVKPRYAVISVGRHNPYGHPASRVLQAYADRGIELYRTDRDGAVWITGTCSSADLEIHVTREQQPQRVPFPRCLWDCERSNWERSMHRWSD